MKEILDLSSAKQGLPSPVPPGFNMQRLAQCGYSGFVYAATAQTKTGWAFILKKSYADEYQLSHYDHNWGGINYLIPVRPEIEQVIGRNLVSLDWYCFWKLPQLRNIQLRIPANWDKKRLIEAVREARCDIGEYAEYVTPAIATGNQPIYHKLAILQTHEVPICALSRPELYSWAGQQGYSPMPIAATFILRSRYRNWELGSPYKPIMCCHDNLRPDFNGDPWNLALSDYGISADNIERRTGDFRREYGAFVFMRD